MGMFRVAAFAAMTSLACFPSMAEASACWYPDEACAAQIRGLQTMLMVGTLQCRAGSQASEYLYTDFIVNQRRVLDENNAILKARFGREAGWNEGQRAYDRFATALANRYSERLDDPTFCATVQRFSRLAAGATRQQLAQLADAVAEPPATNLCRSTYSRIEHYVSPPAPPRISVADVDEAPAAAPTLEKAQSEPVMTADAGPGSATMERATEARAEAVVRPASVTTTEPAAAAAVPNRDDKLEAAIAALQSAVTALQAVNANAHSDATPHAAAEVDAKAADPGHVTVIKVPGDRVGR